MWADRLAVLPVIVIGAWAVLLTVADLYIPEHRRRITAILAALGLIVGLVVNLFIQRHNPQTAYFGLAIADGFSSFLNVLFLLSGLLGIAVAHGYLQRQNIARSEYYSLLLFSISGMMLMGMAADLIIVFIALELLSIPLYVMAGFHRDRLDSEEAALKYFLLGAFAGGFVVYGIALIYGATGSTRIAAILSAVQSGSASPILLTVGAALILVGLGFKVAAVPFHMWTPDVYQGAPSSVTAFMAVGAKAAGFAALLRVFLLAFPTLSDKLVPLLWALAALTMIVGNIVAIVQSNIKRLLAYSSIAHAGYILMATVTLGQSRLMADAAAAALFYLLAYLLTNFGAWAVVIALEREEGKGLSIQDYAGLGKKYPALAAAMSVFMLSLIGVPPTVGFLGKFYLFRAVLEGGFVGLAVIGVLTSLVSAYYYLRVVVVMYMQEGEPVVNRDALLHWTAALSAIAVLALSLFATPLFQWATQATLYAAQ
ncbi:MAG: NADH-quinone oxidoreductase subunit N [Anaerolineales bacterium]|nr:NADH-quinone oxidoreductase subunit N [Anaerolineales bacterium]MCS7248592.1 NADH-quinone oxidoreductase subunit N [Anaerolineales bacterium]MDW8162405.1 NADH-quinone oxidoreductase subunit N [Anaerolineales bacterium]MDW8448323.1 NADH-quinone oxidoreductase subunit N [Anaerolineales bacterium]